MYESWFGLSVRPFTLAPRLDEYVPTSGMESARQTLMRCVSRGAGPGVLVGGVGTGKTLLSHVLANEIRPTIPLVVVEATGITSRQSLLQWILFTLGQDYRQMDEGELRLLLTDYLTSSDMYPEGMVLVVDDAHVLSEDTCDEIMALSNLVRDGSWCVHLLLTGKPQLEDKLAHSRLESFHQRVVARCYLHPLSRKETIGYVQQHMTRAGATTEPIFSNDAVEQIHDASGGIPRLINQICDHVLVLAAVGQVARVDATAIQEAWADLQQLPAPVSVNSTSSVVEFGSLPEVAPVLASPSSTGASVSDSRSSINGDANESAVASTPSVDSPRSVSGIDEDVNEAVVMAPLVSELARLESEIAHFFEPQSVAADVFDSLNAMVQPTSRGEDSPQQCEVIPVTSANGTPIKLLIPKAVDPFVEQFEDEEIVINDLGTLRNSVVKDYPLSQSDECQQLQNTLDAAVISEARASNSREGIEGVAGAFAPDATAGDIHVAPVWPAVNQDVFQPYGTASGPNDGENPFDVMDSIYEVDRLFESDMSASDEYSSSDCLPDDSVPDDSVPVGAEPVDAEPVDAEPMEPSLELELFVDCESELAYDPMDSIGDIAVPDCAIPDCARDAADFISTEVRADATGEFAANLISQARTELGGDDVGTFGGEPGLDLKLTELAYEYLKEQPVIVLVDDAAPVPTIVNPVDCAPTEPIEPPIQQPDSTLDEPAARPKRFGRLFSDLSLRNHQSKEQRIA